MRRSVHIAWVVLLAFLGATLGQAEKPPNLLLFLADDMTYTDVGCFGNSDIRTPYIDRLAKQGMRLTRCYNSAPTCSPLRQSLFTGLYPVKNGAHPNHSQVRVGVRSLPQYLRPLGYRVGLAGKRHEAPASAFPFEQLGGSHGDGGKTPYGADLPMDRAKAFLARDAEQPWCLVVASNQPHTPWNRGDSSSYPPEKLTVPPYLVDTKELREGLSKYYAEISYMDQQVGQVLGILRELKQEENTLIIWLSEQGAQLPFGKWTCYDMGIHSAAVVRWRGKILAGAESEALVSYVDIVPTFLEMAGGEPEAESLDGRSFLPVLLGQAQSHHESVFAINTTRGIYHGSEAYGIRAVTDGDWLFIRNLHPQAKFQNMVTHRDPIFASWKTVDSDFARSRVERYVKRPAVELFNLKNDPWCLENLAGSPRLAKRKRELSRSLSAWMKEQGDDGDATERLAKTRQPNERPWAKRGVYYQPK